MVQGAACDQRDRLDGGHALSAEAVCLPRGGGARIDKSETFKIMERRLLKAITTPAMVASFIFGGLMLATPGAIDWSMGWVWAKIALIVAMTAMHGFLGKWRKDFEADRNTRPGKFYRMMNEVPTLLMIFVVILVIVKPF